MDNQRKPQRLELLGLTPERPADESVMARYAGYVGCVRTIAGNSGDAANFFRRRLAAEVGQNDADGGDRAFRGLEL
jgi:hypothetical protein